jgi:hypothetical protein
MKLNNLHKIQVAFDTLHIAADEFNSYSLYLSYKKILADVTAKDGFLATVDFKKASEASVLVSAIFIKKSTNYLKVVISPNRNLVIR